MGEDILTLASIVNSLGTKYDLLDLVDHLADMFYADDAEKRQVFREKCLFSQRQEIM